MTADRALAVEARLGLFLARYGLRLLGFRFLVKTIRRGRSRAVDPQMVRALAAAVDDAAIGQGYTCLPRAFAAAWMLQRRGHGPTLHYGVRREGGEMQAHAWLEVNGLPVVGHDQSRDFTLLARFPPDLPQSKG